MNSSILILKTWLIILKIIKLVKYLLKKGLNTLSELKNAEITKEKKCTPKQKELLNLFNDFLGKILTDKTLESKSQENDENVNANENLNEDDKTLMSSDKDDDYDDENEDDERMSQSKIIK